MLARLNVLKTIQSVAQFEFHLSKNELQLIFKPKTKFNNLQNFKWKIRATMTYINIILDHYSNAIDNDSDIFCAQIDFPTMAKIGSFPLEL